MIRPTAIRDLVTCERELDESLRQLRELHGVSSSNLLAQASIEYRVGALRRRREDLR